MKHTTTQPNVTQLEPKEATTMRTVTDVERDLRYATKNASKAKTDSTREKWEDRAVELDRELAELNAAIVEPEPEPDPEDALPSGNKIFRPGELDESVADRMVMPKVSPQDLLMWVGGTHYPTIREFVEEAREFGVSKRVGRLPRDLVPGKSRIFFAHDEGEIGDAVIFGYAMIQQVEVIVANDRSADAISPHAHLTIKWVTLDEAALEPDRGCGRREDVGATYLVAYETLVAIEQLEGASLAGPLVLFGEDQMRDYNQLIDADARRFRGYKEVNGDEILASTTYKSAPALRVTTKVEIPERTAGSRPWSDAENDALFALVEEVGSPSKACRRYDAWRFIDDFHGGPEPDQQVKWTL